MNKPVYISTKEEAKNFHLARYELESLIPRTLEEDGLRGITAPQHRKSKMMNNDRVIEVSACFFGLCTSANHHENRKRKQEGSSTNAVQRHHTASRI